MKKENTMKQGFLKFELYKISQKIIRFAALLFDTLEYLFSFVLRKKVDNSADFILYSVSKISQQTINITFSSCTNCEI